jgi:hypothetical protein
MAFKTISPTLKQFMELSARGLKTSLLWTIFSGIYGLLELIMSFNIQPKKN